MKANVQRRLEDLESVGKETMRDFARLKIVSVKQLAKSKPESLYERLWELSGTKHDICVLDTLRCAVAQAKNPNLPKEQRKWWYWSQKRKLVL